MKPLLGKRILVTRARTQASDLVERLAALGAVPLVLPAIEIVPPVEPVVMPDGFDWWVFTSSNGVRGVADWLSAGLETRIAAVGPATAACLAKFGRTADVVPLTFLGDAIPDALGDVAGQRVLWVRGDLARGTFVETLERRGARVSEVIAYRTVSAPWAADDLPTPDALTFTSSSGVLGTHERLAERRLLRWLEEVPILCIGPVTADTVRCLGYPVAATAREHTIPGLVEAVVEWANG